MELKSPAKLKQNSIKIEVENLAKFKKKIQENGIEKSRKIEVKKSSKIEVKKSSKIKLENLAKLKKIIQRN